MTSPGMTRFTTFPTTAINEINSSTDTSQIGLYIGLGIAVAIIIILLLAIVVLLYKRKKSENVSNGPGSVPKGQDNPRDSAREMAYSELPALEAGDGSGGYTFVEHELEPPVLPPVDNRPNISRAQSLDIDKLPDGHDMDDNSRICLIWSISSPSVMNHDLRVKSESGHSTNGPSSEVGGLSSSVDSKLNKAEGESVRDSTELLEQKDPVYAVVDMEKKRKNKKKKNSNEGIANEGMLDDEEDEEAIRPESTNF